MHRKVLAGYIIFIFILQSVAAFMSPKAAGIYLSIAIFAMGIGAILCQKKFHRGSFTKMGFRLNRNALIGLGVGLVFTAVMLILHYWLPLKMGLIELTLNEGSEAVAQGKPSIVSAFIIVLVGGVILFIAALFGEELTFRGYILPKLEEIFGALKAVIVCSVVFALWHLPVYFSLYSGGAAEQGWTAVAEMLTAHWISAIPICILYLTTRELYGVSLYHALVDAFQYSIVGNPAFGDASKDAFYSIEVLNEPVFEIMGWILHAAGIIIMLVLCRAVKGWTSTKAGVRS